MARISILGGTGYAGSNIAREAVQRGHHVTAYSRHVSGLPAAGVTQVAADVLAPDALDVMTREVDVVVSALSPRGPLAGRTRSTLAELAGLAARRGVRLGVIGGAGSLRIGDDGPLVQDTDHVPAEFKAEAAEMSAVLDDLRAADDSLDWFYVSPAAGFGPWSPGTLTRVYRIGGDQLLVDAEGRSEISGQDLAHAVIDEIETPAHRRVRFSVAY